MPPLIVSPLPLNPSANFDFPIENLFPEIRARIFGHLDSQSKQNVVLVSHSWKTLVLIGSNTKFKEDLESFVNAIQLHLLKRPKVAISLKQIRSVATGENFLPIKTVRQFKKAQLIRGGELADLLTPLDLTTLEELKKSVGELDRLGILGLAVTFATMKEKLLELEFKSTINTLLDNGNITFTRFIADHCGAEKKPLSLKICKLCSEAGYLGPQHALTEKMEDWEKGEALDPLEVLICQLPNEKPPEKETKNRYLKALARAYCFKQSILSAIDDREIKLIVLHSFLENIEKKQPSNKNDLYVLISEEFAAIDNQEKALDILGMINLEFLELQDNDHKRLQQQKLKWLNEILRLVTSLSDHARKRQLAVTLIEPFSIEYRYEIPDKYKTITSENFEYVSFFLELTRDIKLDRWVRESFCVSISRHLVKIGNWEEAFKILEREIFFLRADFSESLGWVLRNRIVKLMNVILAHVKASTDAEKESWLQSMFEKYVILYEISGVRKILSLPSVEPILTKLEKSSRLDFLLDNIKSSQEQISGWLAGEFYVLISEQLVELGEFKRALVIADKINLEYAELGFDVSQRLRTRKIELLNKILIYIKDLNPWGKTQLLKSLVMQYTLMGAIPPVDQIVSSTFDREAKLEILDFLLEYFEPPSAPPFGPREEWLKGQQYYKEICIKIAEEGNIERAKELAEKLVVDSDPVELLDTLLILNKLSDSDLEDL